MEFRGTKPPWNYVEKNRVIYIINNDNVLVAELDITQTWIDFIQPTPKGVMFNTHLIKASPELLEALIEDQEMIKIMLENNIGRGRQIGKTYLSKRWESNQKLINKALNIS